MVDKELRHTIAQQQFNDEIKEAYARITNFPKLQTNDDLSKLRKPEEDRINWKKL